MELRLPLTVPVDHPCFEGHFPDAPILPGVVLLDMIMHQLGDTHGVRVAGIAQTKFLAPLRPGERAEAICTPAGECMAFRVESIRHGQVVCVATGRLRMDARPQGPGS